MVPRSQVATVPRASHQAILRVLSAAEPSLSSLTELEASRGWVSVRRLPRTQETPLMEWEFPKIRGGSLLFRVLGSPIFGNPPNRPYITRTSNPVIGTVIWKPPLVECGFGLSGCVAATLPKPPKLPLLRLRTLRAYRGMKPRKSCTLVVQSKGRVEDVETGFRARGV